MSSGAHITDTISDWRTCSDETTRSLQRLLEDDTSAPARSEQLKGSTNRTVKSSKPVSRSKSSAIKTSRSLSDRERRSLATEVINCVLRALTEIAKAATDDSTEGCTPISSSSSRKGPISKHTSKGSTAGKDSRYLKERPLNDRTLPLRAAPNAGDKPHPAKPSPVSHDSPAVAVAQCGVHAFTFLCTRASPSSDAESEWQIHLARLAFIRKLLSLRQWQTAVHELKTVRLQLSGNLLIEGPQPEEKINAWVGDIPSLLEFPIVNQSKLNLKFLKDYFDTGIALLKLAKDPRLIERVSDSLIQKVGSALIEPFRKLLSLSANRTEVSRIIQGLSNSILQLCPRMSKNDDVSAYDVKISPKPEFCLQLQTIAFILQALGLQGSDEAHRYKDLVNSFVRTLDTAARRCQSSQRSYQTILDSFEMFCSYILPSERSTEDPLPDPSTLQHLYTAMCRVAQSATNLSEAQRWAEKTHQACIERVSPEEPTCGCFVSMAAVNLKSQEKIKDENLVAQSLHKATASLVTLSSLEFEALKPVLRDAEIIRNIVLRWLYMTTKSEHELSRLTLHACLDFTVGFLRLLLVVDENLPANETAVKGSLLRSIAPVTVEAALGCIHLLNRRNDIVSGDLDSHLSLCEQVVLLHENNAANLDLPCCDNADMARRSPFVKISSQYWHAYGKDRSKHHTEDTNLQQLVLFGKRACSIVANRCVYEVRAAEFYHKSEKIAKQLHRMGNFAEADDILVSAIMKLISCETLPVSSCSSAVSNNPQLQDEDMWMRHGKLLKSLIGMRMDASNVTVAHKLHLDNPSLDFKTRSFLLLSQLEELLVFSQSPRNRSFIKVCLNPLAQQLLALTNDAKDRPRRMIVMLLILRISIISETELSALINDAISSMVRSEYVEILKLDGPSEAYAASLKLSLGTLWQLQNADTSAFTISELLCSWRSLIEPLTDEVALLKLAGGLEQWMCDMWLLSDYLESQGYYSERLQVLDLIILAADRANLPGRHRLLALIQSADVMLSQGDLKETQMRLIESTERMYKDKEIDTDMIYRLHVTSTVLHCRLGDIEQSGSHLSKAGDCLIQASQSKEFKPSFAQILRFADYYHISSLFYSTFGSQGDAIACGKDAVTLLQRSWKTIEGRITATDSGIEATTTSGLISQLSGLSIGSKSENTESKPPLGSAQNTRQLVTKLHQNSLFLAQLLSAAGIHQDAQYYYDQAALYARGTRLKAPIADTLARRGDSLNRAGLRKDAEPLLEEAGGLFKQLPVTKEKAEYQCLIGNKYALQQQWDQAIAAYDEAETILRELDSTNLLLRGPMLQNLSKEKNARTEGAPKRPVHRSKTPNPSTSAPKSSNSSKRKGVPQTSSKPEFHDLEIEQTSEQERLLLKIKLHKGQSLLSKGDTESTMAMLSKLGSDPDTSQEVQAKYRSLLAQCNIAKGIDVLSTHTTLSTLMESCMSLPAVTERFPEPKGQSEPKSKAIKSNVKKRDIDISNFNFFGEALAVLDDFDDSAVVRSSNHIRSQFCSSFVDTSTVINFTSSNPSEKQHNSLERIAYKRELPSLVTSLSERAAARAESSPKNTEQLLQLQSADRHGLEMVDFSISGDEFQSKYLDIIPEDWSVFSISLSGDESYLYILRYEYRQAPFILKLPLARQQSENEEEEPFGFTEASAEMLDIIRESDNTVHAARERPDELSVKGAKSRWWEQREALNERLRQLLLNIENIWLGGFRGVFVARGGLTALAAQFERSLNNILDKHLPSRRKIQKLNNAPRVDLDPNISRLFIGLYLIDNDNDNDNEDIEDSLSDLLYFVVDILQFNGETNAYDEIDFDAMIIETKDALQAICGLSERTPASSHTILILDKRLHCLPWESLPCLDNKSVSRASSLVDLRERILEMRQSPALSSPKDTFAASRTNGHYILNPSGDLTKTQTRFESRLARLEKHSSWTGSTGRAVTEDEFAATLTPSPSRAEDPHPVLLYFGHGAGTQYIRRRRIARLRYNPGKGGRSSAAAAEVPHRTCAVALLFGCSSAALTECGEYAPYGPPATYLVAGAPAMLGSLWDVTDGDIDAFAAGTLERWGLLEKESGEEDGEGDAKGRRKKKKGASARTRGGRRADLGETRAEEERPARRVCLSEAAARSRGECYLRYLNGAAMVVYGVPVFLAE